jgi:hypothetical protein
LTRDHVSGTEAEDERRAKRESRKG